MNLKYKGLISLKCNSISLNYSIVHKDVIFRTDYGKYFGRQSRKHLIARLVLKW